MWKGIVNWVHFKGKLLNLLPIAFYPQNENSTYRISTFLSKKSMCIVSNWVNEAQDLMAVTKYDDLPNSLIPNIYVPRK